VWNSDYPGFKLPESLQDKSPPSKEVETAAGLGLAVFLVGMVGMMLGLHALHALNGYTMAVCIVLPAGAAWLLVRALVKPPDRLSALPPEDRPTYPRRSLWDAWLHR
jgi:hypothetical protein